MHSEILRDLVVIFAVAVVVVALLRRVGVPAIAGFIVAGIIVGPSGFSVISDVHEVETLAEIGVVLLLFGIGLELSFNRMRRLWRLIVFGGLVQVGVTTALVCGVALVFGLPLGAAVFLGCVIAVSSTAIVLSGLRARGELDAPHGRFTLGILVFQDLCVVPMMLAVPLLAGAAGRNLTLFVALGKALVVLAGVLVIARLIAPPLLRAAAQTRQRDLFVLAVFLVCIGTAWAVSAAGVSLALGAFLAGLVVAGSDFRHQALSEVIPFREVFASLFFVSVGMLLTLSAIAANFLGILSLLVAILLGKFLIVMVTGVLLRLPLRVCIMAGAALAQVGEFSFVLMTSARDYQLLPDPLGGNLLAAVILSMLVTPLAIAAGPALAAGVGRVRVLTGRLQVRTPGDAETDMSALRDHVIIAGYGLAGQELAYSLRGCDVPYVIVDLNAENVRRAIAQDEPAFFGDVTSPEVLEALALHHARKMVIVINDSSAIERTVRIARRLAPELPVVVRAQYAADIEDLLAAGATDVITAEIEASAQVTARVLERYRVAEQKRDIHTARIRKRRKDETQV